MPTVSARTLFILTVSAGIVIRSNRLRRDSIYSYRKDFVYAYRLRRDFINSYHFRRVLFIPTVSAGTLFIPTVSAGTLFIPTISAGIYLYLPSPQGLYLFLPSPQRLLFIHTVSAGTNTSLRHTITKFTFLAMKTLHIRLSPLSIAPKRTLPTNFHHNCPRWEVLISAETIQLMLPSPHILPYLLYARTFTQLYKYQYLNLAILQTCDPFRTREIPDPSPPPTPSTLRTRPGNRVLTTPYHTRPVHTIPI
jgi:hypothetical protein